jgi:NAD(P)-dependent dehydrogenase (short-subunit alcohol dehydrogenase family)
VSAMGSHFSLPGTGALHSSKHAFRAVSEAMRMELRPFGISVCMVEPGPIRTAFPGTANATFPPPTGTGPYDGFHAALAIRLAAAYRPGSPLALSAEDVARVIERAVRGRHPKARYPVGAMSRGVVALKRLLPYRAIEALVRWQFPAPDPKA